MLGVPKPMLVCVVFVRWRESGANVRGCESSITDGRRPATHPRPFQTRLPRVVYGYTVLRDRGRRRILFARDVRIFLLVLDVAERHWKQTQKRLLYRRAHKTISGWRQFRGTGSFSKSRRSVRRKNVCNVRNRCTRREVDEFKVVLKRTHLRLSVATWPYRFDLMLSIVFTGPETRWPFVAGHFRRVC